MPSVSALYKFPIKSCAGFKCDWLMFGERGPKGDRMFMVTDEHYVFRTQRRENGGFTKMVFIEPDFVDNGQQMKLLFRHDIVSSCTFTICDTTQTPVRATIHGEVCDAIDQGDEVSNWLTNVLGSPCRLVRMTDEFYREVDPIFSPKTSQTSFADAYPALLISDASLADLNARLKAQGKSPVSRENFRSCIWTGDCEPFEEDNWEQIRINGVIFDIVKPCQRCSITQVDIHTGKYRVDQEPLITLRTYRHQKIEKTGKSGVMFGQNLVHRNQGFISVGNQVQILKRK